jgi:hypothetical protein
VFLADKCNIVMAVAFKFFCGQLEDKWSNLKHKIWKVFLFIISIFKAIDFSFNFL